MQASVPVEYLPARDRRNLFAREHDPCKVGRIGSRHGDHRCTLAVPSRPQRLHRLGHSELLACKAADETPSANLSPRLETPQYSQQISPAWSVRLARKQITKQYTI